MSAGEVPTSTQRAGIFEWGSSNAERETCPPDPGGASVLRGLQRRRGPSGVVRNRARPHGVYPPVVLAAILLALVPAAQDPPISLELRVERAIARGVGWLRRQQSQLGTFPGHEADHPGGETALAGLTLLKAGVPAGDVAVDAAARALAEQVWTSTYAASVGLLFQEALRASRSGTEVAPPAARAALDFLVANQREGLWGYPADPIDLSNTQFALLGLRAAHRLGLDVPYATVEQAARALVRWQDASGGFAYRRELEPTGGMTAAALGGFAVLAEFGATNQRVREVLAKRRKDLERAEAWLAARFAAARNPYGERAWTTSFHMAYLWAVERWCGFTERERVGQHDWYRAAAEELVARQKSDGSFGTTVDETCFALLVLRRATVTGWQDLRELYKRLDREKAAENARPALVCAPDVPRTVDWLLAGPLRDARGAPALWKPPFDPARVEPRERSKAGDDVLRRVALKPDGWTELEDFAVERNDHQLWVLAARLSWDGAEATRVRLWIQAEDGWRAFLDGREVGRDERVQSAIDEVGTDPFEVAPGEHRLVVLVSDVLGASAFGLRASGEDGVRLPAGFAIDVRSGRKGSAGR